jgi:hypothetical protein
MEKRQRAMFWWHNLPNEQKNELSMNYYQRNWFNLTGSEIQKIYEDKHYTFNVSEGAEDVRHL